MRIQTINRVDAEKLEAVKEEMKTLGTPEIRAYWDGEVYWAIEGTHRLAAAHELGLMPNIVEIEYNDDEITVQLCGWDDEEVIASELIDDLMNHANGIQLIFED